MSNPDETLRNLYPRFMNAMDYTIALLEEERDEALAEVASLEQEVARLQGVENENKLLRGKLAQLIQDKEIGEVLESE
jgi:cell shape-determining protein MreC